MKKYIYIILSLIFSFTQMSCEDKWKNYTAPIDKEGVDRGPKLTGDKVRVKVMSIGTFHMNEAFDEFAQMAKDYDVDFIVARQLDVKNERSGLDIDQAAILADRADIKYRFISGQDYRQGYYGIAVYSKEQNYGFVGQVLPSQRPVGLIKSTVKTEKGVMTEITFVGAMLDDLPNTWTYRERQLTALLNMTRDIEKTPVIMAGNFYIEKNNLLVDNVTLTVEEQFLPVANNSAFSYPKANATTDFVYYKWLKDHVKVIDYKLLPSPTDFLVCYTEIEFDI